MSETQSLSQKNLQPIERVNSFPKEFTAKYDAKEGLFLCLQYMKHVALNHQA